MTEPRTSSATDRLLQNGDFFAQIRDGCVGWGSRHDGDLMTLAEARARQKWLIGIGYPNVTIESEALA